MNLSFCHDYQENFAKDQEWDTKDESINNGVIT